MLPQIACPSDRFPTCPAPFASPPYERGCNVPASGVTRGLQRPANLQKRLGKRGALGNTWSNPVQFKAVATPHKKRTMSAEGRARIAEAQRKRWAARKGK